MIKKFKYPAALARLRVFIIVAKEWSAELMERMCCTELSLSLTRFISL